MGTGQGYSRKVYVLVPLAVLTMCHKFSGLNQHSYLTVLEVRSVKVSLTGLTSRYRQGCVPSGGSRKESVLAFSSFQWLPTSLGL